ncbi:uncharacterized protein LOC125771692 [Anopheles funestus]|uniref:uncharacterized protein LOC125771692 n=1 Tax=Anopheles funestus TaxID=62324 RepID=UPI0020C5D9B9|nr:uncharacterized protein LOC125771692 [Anopheles funestus]
MENNKEDEQEDFIESSQVPTLRSKIREKRPNYLLPKTPIREKRKPRKRLRDNKTVSQCLRQVWKKSPSKPPSSATATKQPATNVTAPEEEYVTFASQQQAPNGNGIQPMPSVSLFDQQDNALARYISNQTTEAQVEAELEKLLDGFQAEYEQKCAEMERSPVHYGDVPHTTSLQSICLSCTSMELEAIPVKEGRSTVSPLQVISDLIPNFNEEIQRVEEMMENETPLKSDPLLVPVSVSIVKPMKEISQVTETTEAIPIVTGNAWLDLSKQNNQSTVENTARELTPKTVVEERAQSNLNLLTAPQVEDVLDLRIKNAQAIPHTVKNCPVGTTDCGIQTNIRSKRRNVAVQHRSEVSLEFTNRNIIVLAQQFEADPSILRQKLRRIAKTSNEAIWRARDLSAVFTKADPYYANLKHFL